MKNYSQLLGQKSRFISDSVGAAFLVVLMIFMLLSGCATKQEWTPEFWLFNKTGTAINRGPIAIECKNPALTNYVCMPKEDLAIMHSQCF